MTDDVDGTFSEKRTMTNSLEAKVSDLEKRIQELEKALSVVDLPQIQLSVRALRKAVLG